MRSNMHRLFLSVLLICVALQLHLHGKGTDAAQQHTPVIVTRIYTGADGQTHAEEITLKLTPVNRRYGQWREESQPSKATSSEFVRFAPGFFQSWHPAAARRYVVTLSGHGEVELANGQKIPLTHGRVLQAEDVTGKGHITRTVGNEDWIALFVQFDQ